ncbi:hypothetical protein CAC42_2152 [Sphaceloma murrayae]|uniref:Uncharacterized protein n=1 Tax=Sphaceloma murrayae TaxID=2082308 RepID=A0A2K1QJ95_9PEZI|nr:hypothetical protein CAC42_2152 [Sphaceloma murrayae]
MQFKLISILAALAGTAMADFAIWTVTETNAADPNPIRSALFVPDDTPGLACGDFDTNPLFRETVFADPVTDEGGANCDRCELDPTDIARYEFFDGQTPNDTPITNGAYGFVTLRRSPEDPNRYNVEFLNRDRTSGGIIADTSCVRSSGDFLCARAVFNFGGDKLFWCTGPPALVPRA